MSRPGNVDAPGVRVGPGQWSGDDVAERIVALWGDAPPRCGATRVVAIDGLSGAGTGLPPTVDALGQVRLARVLDAEHEDTRAARGLLTATWNLEGSPREDVLAVLR